MNSILSFIEQQPAAQRILMQQLRQLILEAAPQMEESLKWKIPFYSYKGLLCYLNPQAGEVVLGFCRGALLSNAQGLLQGCGKEVRLVHVACNSRLPETALRQLLQEALLLNESMQQRKNYYV